MNEKMRNRFVVFAVLAITATAFGGLALNITAGVVVTEDIIINEIMYNPSTEQGTATRLEWLELYNNDEVAININDWTIDDNPITGEVMQPGDYVVLARNKTAFEDYYGALTCPVIEVTLSLTNDEDTVVLKNAVGAEIDNVTYIDDWGADGNGGTLELNETGGWVESLVDGGTPCEENSVSWEREPPLVINATATPSIIAINTETTILHIDVADRDSNISTVTIDLSPIGMGIMVMTLVGNYTQNNLTWLQFEHETNASIAGTFNLTVNETDTYGNYNDTVSIELTVITSTMISIGDGAAAPGEAVLVPLMITDVTGADAVEVNLTFNESIVNVTACTNSDFDIPPESPPTDRGPGWVVINAGQVWSAPLNGDVKICDVTLQAVGSEGETSPLNLTDVGLQDTNMQDIPHTLRNGTFTTITPTIYISISIGNGTANVGGTDVVPLMINNVTGAAAVEVNLTFNESIVNVTACTNSDFDIPPESPPTDRGQGWVVINAGQVWSPPLDGDVKICDVTLQAVGSEGDTSPLNLTDVGLQDINMQDIPHTLSHGTFAITSTIISIGNGTANAGGGTAVVPLMINNVTDAATVEVNLTFDESIVNVTACTNSDFDIPPQNPPADRGPGWVVINAGQVWSPPLDGDVKICDVTLQAVGSEGDTSPLNLTDVELQDMSMRDIPIYALTNGTFRVNSPPMPNITSPADGATISGVVTIEEVDESGEEDVVYSLFEYYYDTNCNDIADEGNTWIEIGNDTDGTDGWSAGWDTAALSDCCYVIRATMGDELELTGNDTINVALSNHAPEPNITSPANGSIIGGLVTIEETDESFDAGADIAYNLFEYYYDENCNCVADDGNEWMEIGNDTSPEGGWSVQWDTRGVPIGCYMIRATMGDKHGLTGTDEINVEMDSIPPSVTDTNATPEVIPDDTDNNPRWGENSTLNVTVTDEGSGVSGVSINLSQIGGSPIQPMTNMEGDIWSVRTNASAGTTPGTYDLVINATDTAGNSNTTANVSLRVQKNGDVQPYDGNGKVDFMGDAMYLLRHTRNVGGYEDIRENIADVTGDCAVDFMGDAMYLLRHTRNVGGYEILK